MAPEPKRGSDTAVRGPQRDPSPYADHYDYIRPDYTTEDEATVHDNDKHDADIEDPADFHFQYNTPPREAKITPGVGTLRSLRKTNFPCFLPKIKKKDTVDSKIIRALEIVHVRKLIFNAVLRKNI